MKTLKIIMALMIILMVISIWVLCVNVANAERYTICEVDAGGGLNVRSGPGVEYRAYFKLSDGAKVAIIETLDNWALVNFRSLIGKREPFGWVNLDYLIKCYEVEIK